MLGGGFQSRAYHSSVPAGALRILGDQTGQGKQGTPPALNHPQASRLPKRPPIQVEMQPPVLFRDGWLAICAGGRSFFISL